MNIENIIKSFGYAGIAFIIFAESGLLIGFFLPGDSLLFTAGLLAQKGFLNIWVLLTITFFAAILGDSTGYTFGNRVGKSLFKKPNSRFFNHENLEKTEKFYEKHGPTTIILARFIPIIRTFAPVVAGISKMKYSTFLLFNLIGGFLWTIGITILGYFLGSIIPDIDKYLLPIILLIVIVSFLPAIHKIATNAETRIKIVSQLKETWNHLLRR